MNALDTGPTLLGLEDLDAEEIALIEAGRRRDGHRGA
jgi:hypothetical protein